MKTTAAVLTQLNAPLEILELEVPPLKRGQVLVDIHYSGLCHAQINEWRGIKGEDPFLPHTLGHEGSGIVLDIGEGVTKVKPGDCVVLSWIKGSGIDVPNTTYKTRDGSIVNSGAISTFLQHAVISENRVIPINNTTPLREAALLGCAIPTGAGIVMNDMKVKENESIVIFGVGGIGLSALLAASQVKAYPIVAIDIHDDKLLLAKKMGATETIHAKKCDVSLELASIFKGKGADYSLESAGKQEAMEAAFHCIRPFGGYCVLAGNLPKGRKIEIDPFELIRGKRVSGSWGGSSSIDKDIPNYVNLFVDRLGSIVTHEVSLEKINHLMTELEFGRMGRGLISFKH